MKNRSRLLILISSAIFIMAPFTASADFYLKNSVSYSVPHGTSTDWNDALERALEREINRDDCICSAPTPFDLWLYDQADQIDPWTIEVLYALSVFYWSIDAKVLADHDAGDEYIGVDGEYTQRQAKTFKDNKRFWDTFSVDILLMGAHGAEFSVFRF